MNCFLGVSQGSAEPLKFLEVEYRGGKSGEAPLAVVGKGVTFDSGGISIKPSPSMDEMRADMGGAACTLGVLYTAARLKLPINLIGLCTKWFLFNIIFALFPVQRERLL